MSHPLDTPSILAQRFYPRDRAADYRARGLWTEDTFASFFPTLAERFGSAEALVARDLQGKPHRLSFSELHLATLSIADLLRARGITPGERILIHLPNTVEAALALGGAWAAGAIPVVALPSHRQAELRHILRASGARAAISHDPQLLAEIEEWDDAGVVHVSTLVAAWIDVRTGALRPEPTPRVQPDPESLGLLQLSGGTTGTPKLIPRTHADYLYSIRTAAEVCELTPATRYLAVLPAVHNFTLSSPGLLGVWWAGGTVVLATDPTPGACWQLITAELITHTALVPPLALTWLAAAERARPQLPSLEVIQVGGAPFAPAAARRLPRAFDCQLQQVFGMGEGLVTVTRAEDDPEVIATTQGRPLSPDDVLRIVDDAGSVLSDAALRAGACGHLEVQGPYTITQYWGGVDAGSFTADGFYRTGDLVSRDAAGNLTVRGRAKDQINRGGEKIAPDEVENLLLGHPAIADAVVIGVPDAVLGERTCACLLLAPGAEAPSVAQVRSYLRVRGIAEYKIPDGVDLWEEFPATGVGKTSRAELRRRIRAAHVEGEEA